MSKSSAKMRAPEQTVTGAWVPLTVVKLGVQAAPSDAIANTPANTDHISVIYRVLLELVLSQIFTVGSQVVSIRAVAILR